MKRWYEILAIYSSHFNIFPARTGAAGEAVLYHALIHALNWSDELVITLILRLHIPV